MIQDADSTQLAIRPMRDADVDEVLAIDRQAFSLPWTERAYRFEIQHNPNSIALVAEVTPENGLPVVVGMAVTWVILDEAHIGTIAVRQDYRRQGIGEKLLVESLKIAAQRDATEALLEVRRSNLPAQKLYERYGFEVVGVRPRYYIDNHEDALLMTLKEIKKMIHEGH